MKLILFIILTIGYSRTTLSQSFDYKLTTINYTSVDFEDSLIHEKNTEDVYSFHLRKFYSTSQKFSYVNGNNIQIHFYSDTTILFEEYDSIGVLLKNGELIVDTMKLSIYKGDFPYVDDFGNPMTDSEGNEILVADTSYFLVPNGLWYYRLDDTKYTMVNYTNGVKHGYSYVKINSSFLPDSLSISKILFDNDIEKTRNNFFIPSQKELTKMIEGIWYHPYCSDYIYYENPIWIFQRNKTNSGPRDGMFSSTFIKDGNYEGEMNYSCGTGRSESDYYPKYKWNIDKNGILKIGANRYYILYVNKDIMTLEEIK